MDDLVKREALLKVMCKECVDTERYHRRGKTAEFWWCPHSKVLFLWSDALGRIGGVFTDIDDQAFFTMLAHERDLALKLAAQAQARMN